MIPPRSAWILVKFWHHNLFRIQNQFLRGEINHVRNTSLHRLLCYNSNQCRQTQEIYSNGKKPRFIFCTFFFPGWTTVALPENSFSFCLRSSSIPIMGCLNIQPTTLTLYRSAPCLPLLKITWNGKNISCRTEQLFPSNKKKWKSKIKAAILDWSTYKYC